VANISTKKSGKMLRPAATSSIINPDVFDTGRTYFVGGSLEVCKMIRTSAVSWIGVVLVLGLIFAAPPTSYGTLLLQYSFDEPSGDALDTGAGPAANGQLMEGAARSSNTPSGIGSSIDFNTENAVAHVLEGDAAKLDGLTALTISTWVNVAAYPGDASAGTTNSGNKRLASKQDPLGAGFTLNMNSAVNNGTAGADDFKIGLFIANTGGSGFTSGTSTADVDANTISAADHWVFLAATYDSALATNNTTFYIGDATTPLAQLGSTLTLGQTTIDAGTGRFGVGFTDALATGFDFSVDGLQDDVRVYDVALSRAELEAVRLAGAIPEPASLMLLMMAGVAICARRHRE
jgi:Concanavalin A-like lectin/glucanases superfamily/PEP-CTERM motif